MTLDQFAALITEQTQARLTAGFIGGGFGSTMPDHLLAQGKAHIHIGPKYTRVDVGTSGKYMVVNATGEIFGIKAYGVIHRGHYFGTLDTVNEYDWSGYLAVRRRERIAA